MSLSAKKTDRGCPLGHECEACLWQVDVTRTNNITQEITQYQSCAITELVPLMEQVFRGADSTADAVNTFRNEVIKGNDAMLEHLSSARGVEQ